MAKQKTSGDINIEYVNIDVLIPYIRNARKHSQDQIDKLCKSIKEFGWTVPLIVDGNNVLAGHARLEAGKRLGYKTVPVVQKNGLTDSQKKAYILADNKLSESSFWDDDLLSSELDLLSDEFDMSDFGFDDLDVGFDLETDKLGVKEIETSAVGDTFWISVRGPIALQAKALQRLQEVMKEMPLEVEIGTTQHDEMGEDDIWKEDE